MRKSTARLKKGFETSSKVPRLSSTEVNSKKLLVTPTVLTRLIQGMQRSHGLPKRSKRRLKTSGRWRRKNDFARKKHAARWRRMNGVDAARMHATGQVKPKRRRFEMKQGSSDLWLARREGNCGRNSSERGRLCSSWSAWFYSFFWESIP